MATKQVGDTARPKPPAAGKGRPKGAQNKTTTALKEAILAAAAEHGEDDLGSDGLKGYLRKVAREDVKAFSGLLGKVLPMQMVGDPDNPILHKVVREIVQPKHSDS